METDASHFPHFFARRLPPFRVTHFLAAGLGLGESIVVAEECERRNASARRSLNKVGGFPLGAVKPAARQTQCASLGRPGCGLGPDGTHGFILFAFPARAPAAPPLPCRKIKKLA